MLISFRYQSKQNQHVQKYLNHSNTVFKPVSSLIQPGKLLPVYLRY